MDVHERSFEDVGGVVLVVVVESELLQFVVEREERGLRESGGLGGRKMEDGVCRGGSGVGCIDVNVVARVVVGGRGHDGWVGVNGQCATWWWGSGVGCRVVWVGGGAVGGGGRVFSGVWLWIMVVIHGVHIRSDKDWGCFGVGNGADGDQGKEEVDEVDGEHLDVQMWISKCLMPVVMLNF